MKKIISLMLMLLVSSALVIKVDIGYSFKSPSIMYGITSHCPLGSSIKDLKERAIGTLQAFADINNFNRNAPNLAKHLGRITVDSVHVYDEDDRFRLVELDKNKKVLKKSTHLYVKVVYPGQEDDEKLAAKTVKLSSDIADLEREREYILEDYFEDYDIEEEGFEGYTDEEADEWGEDLAPLIIRIRDIALEISTHKAELAKL